MKYSKTSAKLRQIADFLEKHNRTGFAKVINDKVIKTLQKKTFPTIKSEYESIYLTVWGGAGSLRDIYLCKQNMDVSENFEKSNRELENMRSELSDLWREEIES